MKRPKLSGSSDTQILSLTETSALSSHPFSTHVGTESSRTNEGRSQWSPQRPAAATEACVREVLDVLNQILNDLDEPDDPSSGTQTGPWTRFVAGDGFMPYVEGLIDVDERIPAHCDMQFSERRCLFSRAIKRARSVLLGVYPVSPGHIKMSEGSPTKPLLRGPVSAMTQEDIRMLRSVLTQLCQISVWIRPREKFLCDPVKMLLRDLEALASNGMARSLCLRRPSVDLPPRHSSSPPFPAYEEPDQERSEMPGSFPTEVPVTSVAVNEMHERWRWERYDSSMHGLVAREDKRSLEAIRARLKARVRSQLSTEGTRHVTKRCHLPSSLPMSAVPQPEYGGARTTALNSVPLDEGSVADIHALTSSPKVDRHTRAVLFQEIRRRSKSARQAYATPARRRNKPTRRQANTFVSESLEPSATSCQETRRATIQDGNPEELLSCFKWCNTEHRDKIRASITVKDDLPGVLDSFEGLRLSNLISDRQRREREEKERENEIEKQRERARLLEEEEACRREAESRRIRQEEERVSQLRVEDEARKLGHLRSPNGSLFPPLSPEWAARVRNSHTQDCRGPLAKSLEADLLKHDFARLVPPTVWLNDSVVNGSLLWLDKFINDAAGVGDVKTRTRKCLVLGSFFYKRLSEQGVKHTDRMLRRHGVNKENLLDIEVIMLPICEGNHWTLMVIRPNQKTIAHVDSLDPKGQERRMLLVQEWIKTILGNLFLPNEWRFVQYSTPSQTNGYDCGVHTILNGICLGLGIDPLRAYTSDELPKHRQNIAAVLLNGGFKGEFSLARC